VQTRWLVCYRYKPFTGANRLFFSIGYSVVKEQAVTRHDPTWKDGCNF